MKPIKRCHLKVWLMALFLFAPLALVQTGQAQDTANPFIQHHDQNNDGKVALEEFAASHQNNFNQMDQNKDGQIDKADRPESGRRLGPMGGRIFKHMDTTGDDVISKAEFTSAVEKRFGRLDKDQNGVVDENEAPAPRPRPRMGMMGAGIVKQLDANKDGKISKDEFSAANEKHFNHLDQNEDGQIDETELPGFGPMNRFRPHGNEPVQ